MPSCNRPTAVEVLEHEYLSSYHDPDDEPSAPPFENKYDDVDYTVEQWQSERLYVECMSNKFLQKRFGRRSSPFIWSATTTAKVALRAPTRPKNARAPTRIPLSG